MDRTDDVLEKCRVFCIRRRHEGSERANEGGSELNCTVPFPCGGWLVGWSRKRQVHLGRGSVVIVHAAAAGRGRTDGRADEMPVDRRAEEEGEVAPAGSGDGERRRLARYRKANASSGGGGGTG